MKIYILLWTLIAIVATVMGVVFIKKYTETKHFFWIFLSLMSYILLILSFSIIFQSEHVVIIYPIVKASSIVIIVILSSIFSKEKLDTQSIIAILMILIAIYMLSHKLT
jgi:multidrug transporter EmrE-like cation transporter